MHAYFIVTLFCASRFILSTLSDSASDINFASVKAGALILESSPGAKGYDNLLNSDKDKYGITECANKEKWVVIGLSEHVLIRSVVITSYEKYSSLVKDFQILASMTHPVTEWHDYGTYHAKPLLGSQSFNLTTPGWGRYLKLKFLSEYGDEHYCTVSQISVHGSAAMETLQQDMDLNDLEVQVMETVMTQLRDTSEEGFVKDAAAGEQVALDPSMIDIESIPGEFVRGDPTLDADPWLPPIVDVSDASTDTQPATVSSMDRGGVDGTAGGSSIEFGGIGFGLVNNGSEHLNSSTETDAVNTVTSFPDIDSGLLSDVSSEPMPQGESEVMSVDKEADREKGVGSDDSAAVAADAAGDAPSALEASVREVEEEVVANGIETDPAARDDAVTTLETGLTADFSDVGIGRVEPTPSDAAADSPAVGETADQQSEVKNESLLADLTVPGEEVNPVGEGGTVDSGDVVDSTDRRAGENVPGSDASSPSAQVASQDDGVVVEDNTAVASDIGAVKVDDTVHVTVEGEASSADSMKPVNRSSAADVNKTITEQTESTPLDKTVETMDYDSVDSDIVSGDTNEYVNQTEFESAGTGKGVKNNATINESNVSSPTEQSTPESLNDSTETELNRTFNAYTASIATEAEDFIEKLDNSSTTIPPVSGSSDPAVSERNDTNATSNIVSVTAYSTSENKSDTVGDKAEKIATSGASMRNGTANETADQGVERSGNSSNHELQQHSTSSENVTRNNSESVNGSSIGGANVTGNGSAVANVTKPPVVAGEAPTLPAGEGSTVQDSASSSPSNIPSTAYAAIAAHGARVKSVNMSCLDNLKYSEFRDKMMSKLEGSTSDSSNSTTMGSAPQGSQDSVFKPLISKIKKLEMKNLINEMYTNQIGDCHRSIFSEILSSWGPNGSMTTAARDALLTLNEAIEGIDSRTVAAASVLDETVSFVKEQRNILQLQAGAFGFYGPLEEGAYLNSSVLAEEIVFNNISRARRVVDSHKAGCDGLSCLPKYLKFLYEGYSSLLSDVHGGDLEGLIMILFISCVISAFSLLFCVVLLLYVVRLSWAAPRAFAATSSNDSPLTVEGASIRRKGFFAE